MNETEQLQGAPSRLSEMKIPIIDDELANVALLEDLLSDSGYTQVKSIMAPRLTMQTCAEFEPDVVLLDLRMPHMDGFAVLEAQRSKSTGAFLPVIVLTADIDAQSKYHALRAGAMDYLLKPFDHLKVLLRMGPFMERRRIEVDPKKEGLGLGLAISMAIIAMHGGTIYARSDGLGQGSTFLITLAVEKRTTENDELRKKADSTK
jgi:DNA-binding response OmpR family regulator